MEGEAILDLSVLRLGHRVDRDKRMTSHLGLTARAFGANRVILSGDNDKTPLETWKSVTARFGGDFECRYESKPMSWLKSFSKSGGKIVHLTMYGKPWNESISTRDLLYTVKEINENTIVIKTNSNVDVKPILIVLLKLGFL